MSFELFDEKICDEVCEELTERSRKGGRSCTVRETVDRFFERRHQRARERGLLLLGRVMLDRVFRTTRPEYLDLPDYSEKKKNRMVNFLHLINTLGTYRTFFAEIEPHLRDFSSRSKTPARVLELASGSGEFIFDIAARAKQKNLALRLTGSDYFDENVLKGNEKAAARGLPVEFKKINMFKLDDIADGSYDFVFITQALHHFTLEEVATIIRHASRLATVGVFALDGRRSGFSLGLLCLAGVVGSVYTRTFALAHDAVVSAIKFFIPSLLKLVLRTAIPECAVDVKPVSLTHIFVKVRSRTSSAIS